MIPSACNRTGALDAIKRVVGDEHVFVASPLDAIDGVMPRWIIEPGTPVELAQALSLANGAGLRVVPRGSGTKLDWGNSPKAVDIVLSTRRLDRILEHAAGDMTATVQAGCTVAAFATALAARGQRLALDPLWPARATIGGIIATHDSGALRAAFGTLRDHLIGITVALADGTIAKSGGKVVKNVAGYDLPKLFTGSFGTLGIITEATFRLYPAAHASKILRFAAATREILGRVLAALGECALVTSAVQIEAGEDGTLGILVMIEGLPEAIAGKVQRVTRAAADCGAEQVDAASDAWTARERLFADPDSCVAKVSLLPTQWPGFIEHVREIAGLSGARWQIIGQAVGVGLVRLTCRSDEKPSPVGSALADAFSGRVESGPGSVSTAPVTASAKADPTEPGARDLTPSGAEESGTGAVFARAAHVVGACAALRAHLEKTGGSFVLLRCPSELKRHIDVWPDVGNALPLMRRIKDQFDPNGILSPGRFVGGI